VEKLGKGVFGVVVKGENIEDKKQYAIKILRKNEITEKSGSIEYKILSELPQDCHHIMKMYDYFHHDGHLCLVCELLSLDLRSYTQKKSVSLEDIRLYAVAMFLTIHEMKKSHIIHADIKPDNYLFRVLPHEEMKEKVFVDNIKLCDFGTSYFLEEHNWKRDEMVARYYRAPEIILGTTPNKKSDTHALDVWAVGCSLYELYTKKFLFNGNDNN
jgi:serine/threonine-protein kinase PRP4